MIDGGVHPPHTHTFCPLLLSVLTASPTRTVHPQKCVPVSLVPTWTLPDRRDGSDLQTVKMSEGHLATLDAL